ncbi:cisplatin damage response ATP-dependent DNA ligase [Henriciella aquimarina]|uniref:cisplatin damage response ATP-dependent DNA ligase n=1 Tax=Henriciella aquimarina TaxID=545261 RepID=UPI000A013376|nr:cisplatin damage response ATP-dependent DNA ligase [Henriciella aquimarina]
MQAFSDLLERLILTPSRNGKIALLAGYFRSQPSPARGWGLAVLTGELDIPGVKAGTIRKLAEDRVDPELFRLSYDYVGDLAETVSLIWPGQRGANRVPPIEDVVETLLGATRAQGERLVAGWLDMLEPKGRWALIKMVTGGLRIGVSARLTKLALAEMGGVEPGEIEEIWHGLEPPYESLFDWLDGTADKPAPDIAAPFRPVMLAHPLVTKDKRDTPDAIDPAMIDPDVFAAEWKYDGIRVQAVSENGTRRIYTRTGDDISHTFPDVLAGMDFEAAIDGELLIGAPNGEVAPFNELQQRLNRKTVTKKQMETRPAFIRAYDILVEGEEDLRPLPFRERRQRLEAFVDRVGSDRVDLSPLVPVTTLEALEDHRNAPPAPEIEGLMLKRWDSVYEAGRPTGPWWKWKRDPFLVDAVLLYAQRGHGRRSSFYSDFTFGVWRDGEEGLELTPVGKAYFGFTDEELKLLDKFVRENTIDRFGPVRAVTATEDHGLVLEVAFEGLNRSPRHKSGLAMRFPRINRIRWDKPAAEADRIETLQTLLPPDPIANP